jgi:NADP-dependent 3-hydroxy acid dehydrogenase YdfG
VLDGGAYRAKLVLAARRADRLKKIVADIETEGGEAITVVTDATNREQVDALVARRG